MLETLLHLFDHPDPTMVWALSFALVGGVTWLVGSRVADGVEAKKRIGRRVTSIGASRAGPKASADVLANARRQHQRTIFGDVGSRLKTFVPNGRNIEDKLHRASVSLGAGDYVLICLLIAAAIALATWLYFAINPLLCLGIGLLAGFHGPGFVLNRRMAKRRNAFVKLFPDAIDLITRSVKSGLPVTEAIHAIGQEVAEPIGPVFDGISHNLRIGISLPEALWMAARKESIPEFKFFVISLVIQQETGGNMSEILRNLATMIRRREQVQLKIKAMSSEARASAMIIGSLPFIMTGVIFVVNPDYIMTLFTDPRGTIALTMAGCSMSTGIFVIARMVRFKI